MYLQISQLNKSYGSRQVVSNVDLAMEEGEILSLLGPSGCGKTTILRMIAGLVTPESGLIKIGDRTLYDGKRELPVEERQLGMVFQDYALWPHMTVARNIAFGMRLRHNPARDIEKRVQELLELVSLPGMGNRYPNQLSGGQQQRVALARALATKPRVLLLDEPLSSLDTSLRETMRTELVQIFKQLKITTINVTHDQDEAMAMSDRIMVLRDGKVQQVGTPAELYMHPTNVFVASFMGPANLLSGEVAEMPSQREMVTLHLQKNATEKLMITGHVNAQVRDRLNGRADMLCRPDDVRVYADSPPSDHANVFPGTVSFSSFVGGQWRTLISLGEAVERPILAFPPFQPEISQRVWLEFPLQSCQVVLEG